MRVLSATRKIPGEFSQAVRGERPRASRRARTVPLGAPEAHETPEKPRGAGLIALGDPVAPKPLDTMVTWKEPPPDAHDAHSDRVPNRDGPMRRASDSGTLIQPPTVTFTSPRCDTALVSTDPWIPAGRGRSHDDEKRHFSPSSHAPASPALRARSRSSANDPDHSASSSGSRLSGGISMVAHGTGQ